MVVLTLGEFVLSEQSKDDKVVLYFVIKTNRFVILDNFCILVQSEESQFTWICQAEEIQ